MGRKLVVFELQLPAHWDYVDNTIGQLAAARDLEVLVTPMAEEHARVAGSPKRARGVAVIPHEVLKWVGRIDAYVSLTQYTLGIPGNAGSSVLVPHGLPSKGNSVIPASFAFEHVFLTGAILEGVFERRMARPLPAGARHPRLHRAGYPKSDRYFARLAPPASPSAVRVVLFAPSYELHTSLFAYGEGIVARLLELEWAQVWVKLHPMLFHADWIRRSGRDWPALLADRYGADPRVRLLPTGTGDEVLEQADAVVTDVSGVAYEYVLLERGPVVFLDCPDFYRTTAPQLWEPGSTLEELGESVYVGRELGIVTDLGGLPEAVSYAISHRDHRREERRRLVERLVFHRGAACQEYVRLIREIAGAHDG